MKEEYVWLSKLEISNSIKFRLLEKLDGIYNLYNSSLDDLVDLGLNDNLIYKILNKQTRFTAKKDLEYMNKNNIDIIWFGNEYYPEKLNLIQDKPISFYIRGNKKILERDSIGVVGSRNANEDSLNFARKISRNIALRGINVISGLARGVDKYSHLGCLEVQNGGKTIAVLGNSIESVYPYENKRVFERILEQGGAVISEYPLNTKPYAYNFPYRNRIISGLSDKIIVIQASIKSGSLITVDYAIEQGKDVFVYKNKDIEKQAFSGNKLLIEQGAKILY